ncbi:hypothetical protein, partial [Mesorhizobium sp. M1E.F.Ca.ET.041.01.1.1]|uniref:hypothetical protein n=1 Tax=Mesorhizobium sp. M1E.F.Ca.ET.041.01.1.1 TaxID=2496759 RepID=UPI001AECB497
ACAAARMVAYSEAYAESFAIGKKAGAAAVDKHFMAIIRACERDDAKLLAAINLTLEFPEITATAIIDMAGKHFTNLRRGSAALALRDTLPNSLQRAVAQLAEEGA